MGGRTMPTECDHGVTLDWGDFGVGGEVCVQCETLAAEESARLRARTERVVRGALQACIHDHGPITQVNVDSAVKRVIGGFLALAAEGSNLLGVGDEHTDCRIQVEALEKRLRRLRHGHERLLAQHAELQRRNADLITAALNPDVLEAK